MYLDFPASHFVLHMYRHMKLQTAVRIMIVNIHLYLIFTKLKEKLKTRSNPTEGKERNLTGLVHMGLYSLLFLPNGV